MVKSGFNRVEPVEVNGVDISPAAFTAALLGSQEQFTYSEDERDVALIRAYARAKKGGEPTRVVSQIIDYRDLKTGFTAMQRTVAFTMSIGNHGRPSLETRHRRTLGSSLRALHYRTPRAKAKYIAEGRTLG